MKTKFFLLTVIFFSTVTFAHADEKRITKDDVVKFVGEAVAFSKANGKDKLLEEISKGENGKFMRGELYLSAYDFEIKVLAHAAKPHMAGKDFSKLRDKKGVLIGEEYIKAIKDGTGWIEYYWQNPVTKKMQKKYGYAEKIDETCWVSAGMYVEE